NALLRPGVVVLSVTRFLPSTQPDPDLVRLEMSPDRMPEWNRSRRRINEEAAWEAPSWRSGHRRVMAHLRAYHRPQPRDGSGTLTCPPSRSTARLSTCHVWPTTVRWASVSAASTSTVGPAPEITAGAPASRSRCTSAA